MISIKGPPAPGRPFEHRSRKAHAAVLLQVPYSARSERQLVEQIQYDLLFRWFMGVPSRPSSGTTRA